MHLAELHENAHVEQLQGHGVYIRMYPNGRMVGLYVEVRKPCIPPSIFCQRGSSSGSPYREAICQLNSAPKCECVQPRYRKACVTLYVPYK